MPLYQSTMGDNARKRQEEWARLLGTDTLVEDDGRYVSRSAVDLDRSVRERALAGTLKATFDPAADPPGRGLVVHVEGEALRLAAGWSPLSVAGGAVMAMAGGLVLLLQGRGVVPAQVIPPWLAVVSLVLGALGVGYQVLFTEELVVSPKRVTGRWRLAGVVMDESALPADNVEEVVIRRGERGLPTVEVLSDRGTVSFGIKLSSAQRRWVRDCVIAVISVPNDARDES